MRKPPRLPEQRRIAGKAAPERQPQTKPATSRHVYQLLAALCSFIGLVLLLIPVIFMPERLNTGIVLSVIAVSLFIAAATIVFVKDL